MLGYLADRGVPAELLERVHVPVGLDLGHTAHREIAVAILAELVQLRAAGALLPDHRDPADHAEHAEHARTPATARRRSTRCAG